MRSTWILAALLAVIAYLPPSAALGQTEGAPGLARDVFRREVIKDSLPPAPAVVEERVVLPARVVRERVPVPAAVVERPAVVERATIVERPAALERPVVQERVVVTPPAERWWDVLSRSRFGYYDDSYFDDNWYYDYYESPAAPVAAGVVRYRTGWFYAPTAERGLFSW